MEQKKWLFSFPLSPLRANSFGLPGLNVLDEEESVGGRFCDVLPFVTEKEERGTTTLEVYAAPLHF